MTCHRIIGDGFIWQGISLMNAWMPAVSVGQWSIMVHTKKKKFNGEIIFHCKRINVVLLY